MTDEELKKLVESVAKTAMANSNLIAQLQREQVETMRRVDERNVDFQKQYIDALRRIDDLRADFRELMIENQRILRYLESR